MSMRPSAAHANRFSAVERQAFADDVAYYLTRSPRPVAVHLIDVSAAALGLSARTLAEIDGVDVVPHQATYEAGLVEIASARCGRAGRTLALFLGSNIGNFDPPGADAFLRAIRASLVSGDALLVGGDLV